MKMPKNLAETADLYYKTRAKRLEMEKAAEAVKADESAMREYLIDNLPKSKLQGVAGKLCRVQIKVTPTPRIADESKFIAYAKRKGNEDLTRVSMNVAAVRERWGDNVTVPGIEAFNVVTLSVNKA